MKHSFLDHYSDRDSLIHRLDPRTKLITTLLLILVIISTPPARWQAFALYFLLLAILILLSRVPALYVLRQSLLVEPFVLMIAIFVPFFKEGEVAASYNIWQWQINVTYNGLQILASIMVKSWLSMLGLILLTSTTKMSSLLRGLEQLKMPRVMVMILSFMYRYIFLLTDEVIRLKQARESRNIGGGKRVWQIRVIGDIIGHLFIRSYERAERVYAAMMARGFDGQSRTLDSLSFKKADACFGVSLALVLIAAGLFSLLI